MQTRDAQIFSFRRFIAFVPRGVGYLEAQFESGKDQCCCLSPVSKWRTLASTSKKVTPVLFGIVF